MSNELVGGCLCGAVRYSVKEQFSTFYLCHCEQCQKVTGSSFAANILTSPENITWTKGADMVENYEHPQRAFSKAFCKICGAGLPHTSKSGEALVIPAGSLTEPLKSIPTANLFVSESPDWLKEGLAAKGFHGFPE